MQPFNCFCHAPRRHSEYLILLVSLNKIISMIISKKLHEIKYIFQKSFKVTQEMIVYYVLFTRDVKVIEYGLQRKKKTIYFYVTRSMENVYN